MALQLELNRASGTPLYRQIAEQIKTRIQDGRLPEGVRLPTVRDLAHSLNVSALTVHNAYSDLQHQGHIESIVGSGTFVSSSVTSSALVHSLWRSRTFDSFMTDLQTVMYAPNLRALATGGPDPSLFCTEAFWNSFYRVSRDPSTPFLYSPATGEPRLQNEISALAEDRGIRVSPDDVFVTGGATRALSLVTQALAGRGDKVLVEQHTYIGFLCMLEAHGVIPIPVPSDSEGPRIDALQELVQEHKPAYFFVIPNFQNPTGLVMSDKRREELLNFATGAELYLVEDDVFGRLSYDGPPPMALKAMDRADRVIYIDSFCKTLFPGLRIGYMIVPEALQKMVVSLLRALDLSGQPLMQRALSRFLEEGVYRAHLKKIVPKYRERRDAMLRSLSEYMPEEVTWTRPKGGFVCWLTMKRRAELEDLYSASLSRGVAIAPGELFCGSVGDEINVRLAFGASTCEEISEAVRVLAQLIKARL